MCITFVQVVFHSFKQTIWQKLVHNNLEADAEAEMLTVQMCSVDKETMADLFIF